jgi:hypothetical protein
MRNVVSIIAGVVGLAAGVASGDIVPVAYGALTGDFTETFEGFDAGNGFEGVSYDGEVANGAGLAIGERFVGQTVTDGPNQQGGGVHDVIHGSPAGPLALAFGPANQNLVIGDTTPAGGTGHAIGGLGSVGWPEFTSMGEGAMAVLFAIDQSDLGFTVFGAWEPGDLRADFYSRDGGLLGSIVIDEVSDGGWGFGTGDGSASIAGVVLTNTEGEGLSFDNVRYHTVPAPGAAALLGLCGLLARRR